MIQHGQGKVKGEWHLQESQYKSKIESLKNKITKQQTEINELKRKHLESTKDQRDWRPVTESRDHRPETGDQRPETGGGRGETRTETLDHRSPEAGVWTWRLETGDQKAETD